MSVPEVQVPGVPLPETPAEGLHLLGVVRLAGPPPHDLSFGEHLLIACRELAAVAHPRTFEIPEMNREQVMLHQQALDRAMQRWTVAPVPFGVVFRDRLGVVRFLEEQYEALSAALALVEGRWEFRVHVREEENHGDPVLVRDVTTHIYAELRRITHAAVPFPREGRTVLSAGFLVERDATSRFLERVGELGELDRDLTLDVTGPWPPYDFVRIAPPESGGAGGNGVGGTDRRQGPAGDGGAGLSPF